MATTVVLSNGETIFSTFCWSCLGILLWFKAVQMPLVARFLHL
jgi:hypothetical protein